MLDIIYRDMVAKSLFHANLIWLQCNWNDLQKITFAVQSTSYNVTSRKFTMYLNCTVYKALPYISKAR